MDSPKSGPPRADLSEKRRPCQVTKGGGNRPHHISASAANLNITTSTWTKHIPPSLFPGSVYSFHLKEKTIEENIIQGITK